jgi:hypothetical protein
MGESGCCVVVGYAPKFLGDLVKCEWTWQTPARDLVNFNNFEDCQGRMSIVWGQRAVAGWFAKFVLGWRLRRRIMLACIQGPHSDQHIS